MRIGATTCPADRFHDLLARCCADIPPTRLSITESSMSRSALVIGGGLAGIATAVALGKHGVEVTLLEARSRLGGRAASFSDPAGGESIDNCQHVSMGCCTNFFDLCETVGTQELFREESRLNFIGPDGRVSPFYASRLPAPLHLFPALVRMRFLNWRDKWHIARGLQRLARDGGLDESRQNFAQWLVEQRQTPAAIERFWKVVLVSALSETLERISVPHARKVFVDGFLGHRQGWVVQIPAVPLDALYGERLTKWFAAHRVTSRLRAPARRLIGDRDRVTGAELRSGELVEADDVVLAVPHFAVSELVPQALRQHPRVAALRGLTTAPIAGVHLWFDRAITSLPHAVLIERQSQWMFRRDVGVIESGEQEQHYYQVVVSAARELEGMPREDAVAAIVAELQSIWPEAREARLLRWQLVIERRAVVSMAPGVDGLRPPQQSPVANLQFAGDWTRTGWPSTMEGAVKSGYMAAENILSRQGRPTRVRQPELPAPMLSKLLMGL